MKKPFKDSKIFKIIKAVAPVIPFNIGSIASELLTNTDTPEGTMNREKAILHAGKLIIYLVLIYLALSGRLTWDQAEEAKDFLGQ